MEAVRTHALLRCHLPVLLDVEVLVRGQHADLVVGDFSTAERCQHRKRDVADSTYDLREAFHELEFVRNPAALLLDLLLGSA